MRALRPRAADANRDRWMVSYMDVLTILLIFFIAAAAQSAMPRPAPEKAHETPAQPQPQPISDTQRKLEALGLDLKREPRGLVISLPLTVLFGSGGDEIGSETSSMVQQIAGILREIPNKVSLVGHADSIPIHNRRFRNNWELASARSLRLLELLGREGGIDESRLSVASYSSYDPKNSNDTPDGRAGNRRVEIVIFDEPASSSSLLH